MARPESIENRWDILYRDYPEVYDAFMSVPYRPSVFEQAPEIIDLRGKTIADVGAGTGKSTLALAKIARQVIGIEYEPAMLLQARQQACAEASACAEAAIRDASSPERDASSRVSFLSGDALAIPLATGSVDLVTAFTLAMYPPERYRDFIREGLRVARQQVVYVGIAPYWYGGDLYSVIDNPYKDKVDVEVDRIFLEEFQFSYQDVFSIQEYGTVETMVGTYGFIFGKNVIEHIRKEKITSVRWKYRVYWRG